jgi:hypothetical protein
MTRSHQRLRASSDAGGDAHDLEWLSFERDAGAHDVAAAAVLALPEVMPEHHRRGAAPNVVCRGEETPRGGLHFEDAEILAADPLTAHAAHLAAVRGVERRLAEGRDGSKSRGIVAHLLPERIREVGARPGVAQRHDHQLVGTWHRQRPKHDGVEQRVDRGVRADAEGERQHGHRGERGGASQGAERVADVGPQRVDPGDDVGVPGPFTLGCHIPEPAPRRAHRIVLRHPARHQRVRMLADVECHLSVDVARETLVARQIEQASDQ